MYIDLARTICYVFVPSILMEHIRSTHSVDVASVIQDLGWDFVAVITDENEDLPTLLVPFNVKMLVFSVNDTSMHNTLETVHQEMFPDIRIVVCMSPEYLSLFMSYADTYDLHSNRTTDFRHHSKWILRCDQDITRVEQSIDHLENVVILKRCTTDSAYSGHLLSLQKYNSGSRFTPVSKYTPSDSAERLFPNIRYGYNYRHLKVLTLPSIGIIERINTTGTMAYRGYPIEILKAICTVLNFSCDVSEPSDKSWGLLKNGSWDGIVGRLHNREADLAACDLTIHDGRSKVIDYIYPPIYIDDMVIVYKKTTDSEFRPFLARTMQSEVFLYFFLITIFVLITYILLERYAEERVHSTNLKQSDGELHPNLPYEDALRSGEHIIRALLKQGLTESPKTTSGKVLLTSWLLLVMGFTVAYCAKLVASLSARTGHHPFTDIAGLVDSDYTVVLREFGITRTILENYTGNRAELRGLREKIKLDSGKLTIEQYMRKVITEKYALITYRSLADKYLAEDCDLSVLKEQVTWEQLAFAVPKQSPFKGDIEKVVSDLRESGILDTWWKKYNIIRDESKCTSSGRGNPTKDDNRSGAEPIAMNKLKEVFILVGCGLVLACLLLLVERLRHAYNLHRSP